MWTRPASTASASSTMWRVPSTLATRWRLGVRGHVVDRGEVEEVVDLALEPLEVLVGDPEAAAARGRRRSPTMRSSSTPQRLRSSSRRPLRALADEHVDRPLALEQQLDQVAADEAGRAGDEVAQSDPPRSLLANTDHPTLACDGLRTRSRPRRPRRTGRQARPHRRLGGRRGPTAGRRRAPGARRAARWSAPPARCRSRRRRDCARASGSRCAYCEHTAIALDFLREGAIDAPANDVVLIARIAV